MKSRLIPIRYSAVICCACIIAASATTGWAQATRGSETSTSRSSTAQNKRDTGAEMVRVTRASYLLGTDVIATDGRKVGDIVDFYLNPEDRSHLDYVVIMTGGFLSFGGDTRAVPASAVTTLGDNCRINTTSDRFWDVPVLPENRLRFLRDAQNRQRISQFFNATDRQAAKASTQKAPKKGSRTDPSGAGEMTGRTSGQPDAQQLFSYNELRNTEAYGKNGERLGYLMDAWINLNDNRAPYIEITATFEPFRTQWDRRYAIPTTKLTQKREYYGHTFDTTTDELGKAEWVSETQGVKMLNDGMYGNTVLRVTVPEN